MLTIPIINPYYIIKLIPNEGVIFLSELGSTVFYEEIYTAILSLIDGEKTVNDIQKQLAGCFDASYIYYVLFTLEQKRYIIEKEQSAYHSEDIYWLSQNLSPNKVKKHLQTQKVAIRTFGKIDDDLLRETLEQSGIQVEVSGVCDVVVTDNYLRTDLSDYNRQALAKKKSWLLIKPNGLEPWIGPLFIPEKTACYQCLHYYITRNHRIEHFASQKVSGGDFISTSLATYSPHLNIAYNIASGLLGKFLINSEENILINNLLSLNTHTFQIEKHPFIKRENCPACGQLEKTNSPIPFLKLQNAKAIHTNESGYRTISPEETIKHYQHLVSPITGIVATLERLPHDPIFVYLAGKNSAFPITQLATLKHSLRNHCSGKGISENQAKASTLCEALERYSGEFQGHETRITATYDELAEKALHPNACMLYSERQYQNQAYWNSLDSKFTRVCDPFDKNAKIEWSPVWSLTSQTTKYLPTQYLYYYYQTHHPSKMYCLPDSNGNAAGNTIEEAILQGLFELTERDAVAIWWYNCLQKPLVSLETFNNPYFSKLEKYYKSQQRCFWVIDVTSDLGIPTFAAISKKINTAKESIILGFGSHLDANIAISRALTEMNQMLVAVNQIEDAKIKNLDSIFHTWLNQASLSSETYLSPNAKLSPKKMADYSSLSTANLFADLQKCQAIIEKKNLEILVLDQTRSEIGLSVVKVLCPGLRHFWARFAKGRLYDVPMEMGWLKKPLLETELNPIPIFF